MMHFCPVWCPDMICSVNFSEKFSVSQTAATVTSAFQTAETAPLLTEESNLKTKWSKQAKGIVTCCGFLPWVWLKGSPEKSHRLEAEAPLPDPLQLLSSWYWHWFVLACDCSSPTLSLTVVITKSSQDKQAWAWEVSPCKLCLCVRVVSVWGIYHGGS